MYQSRDSQATTNSSQLRTQHSTGCTPAPQKSDIAIAWNRLLLDPSDGSPTVEYKIENGSVERRTRQLATQAPQANDDEWQRLTPAQLTMHVLAGTVVAKWLSRRMGVSALVHACDQRSSSASHATPQRPAFHPQELAIGEFSPLLAETSNSSSEGLFNG